MAYPIATTPKAAKTGRNSRRDYRLPRPCATCAAVRAALKRIVKVVRS